MRRASGGLVAAAALVACVLGCAPAPTASPSPTAGGPTGLIEIADGRHLDLTCAGSGGPVVILEAGLGNTSDVWVPVQNLVKTFTTVCRYDRAGMGRSDPRPEPHGATSAVSDLHELLGAAGLAGPYVIVGASYGGLLTNLFARTYPEEIRGVVLVDAIAPAWNEGLEALLTPAQVEARHAIPNGEPLTNEDLRASDRQVEAAPAFPAVKLVVLRHDRAFPGEPGWPEEQVESLWATLQAGLADLSPDSVLIMADGASHRIHQDKPRLVADAIHSIVDPSLWPPVAAVPEPAFGEGTAPVDDGAIPGALIWAAVDGLRTAAMDGTDSRVFFSEGGAVLGEPSIDAAGRQLVFTRRSGVPDADPGPSDGPRPEVPAEIWILDMRTGNARLLAAEGRLPAFSPDGAWVAFSHDGHEWLVHPDGTGLRDIGEGGCPVWSPDGTQLAMCGADGGVFTFRIADSVRTAVPIAIGPNEPTAWLPDGGTLVLISARDGDGEIYIIGVDGSDEHRLTSASGDQNAVAWTSAGLLVTSSLPGADMSDWFVVDPATGRPRAIPWMTGIPIPVAYLASGF